MVIGQQFWVRLNKHLPCTSKNQTNLANAPLTVFRLKESLSKTVDELKVEIENLKSTLQDETNAKENAVNEVRQIKNLISKIKIFHLEISYIVFFILNVLIQITCLYLQLNRLKDERESANSERFNTGKVRVAYSTNSVDRKIKDLRLEVNMTY